MAAVIDKAHAKINGFLHVTGKRHDGYHELESLVFFSDLCDVIHLKKSDIFGFSCTGPYADQINHHNNLCIDAARAMERKVGRELPCHIHLEKNIPVAAGLGGGSADAAAVIRVMCLYFELGEIDDFTSIALKLGADVPMCLPQQSAIVRGIGEKIEKTKLSSCHHVLINPNKNCATRDVFEAFSGTLNASNAAYDDISTYQDLLMLLQQKSNHLQMAAQNIVPEINTIIDLLSSREGCDLARMTGSGATCFGLFADKGAATQAADMILSYHPEWWVYVGTTL